MSTVACYEYPEPNGVVRLRKWRYEPKAFGMEARSRDGYSWVSPVSAVVALHPELDELFPSLLYNLPSLLADPPFIALTEGEKDAATLSGRGVPALSHWQGAQNFTTGQAERFRDYRGKVVLFADADAAGAACAVRRYDALDAVGIPTARMSILIPASGHKDATEHLDAGHSLKEFRTWHIAAMREIAKAAPPPPEMGRTRDYDPGISMADWHPRVEPRDPKTGAEASGRFLASVPQSGEGSQRVASSLSTRSPARRTR